MDVINEERPRSGTRSARMPMQSTVLLSRGADAWTTDIEDISASGVLVKRPDGWSYPTGELFALDMMIGDDLNNDVLAAQVVGMTGVLVRTGKFRQDTLDRWAADEFAMQPNHVVDSVADLPELLGL